MTEAEAEPELPAVGSLWEASDGRLLRVEGWTRPTFYPADDYWADCTVLRRSKGQRSTTQMYLGNFGTSLKPADAPTAPAARGMS